MATYKPKRKNEEGVMEDILIPIKSVDGLTERLEDIESSENLVTTNTAQTITAKKTFDGELKFNSTENFADNYFKRKLGYLSGGTAYANLDSKYKDGTWHRMWRLRFPNTSGSNNFWGRIKITLYGGYSSFNASGVMSKSITCNFNGANIYNNVGCYDGLGVNVEQDFRISEAIWNAEANAWEILIWQKKLTGNNSPTIMLECWNNNSSAYINAFKGITAQPVELTQDTTYTALKASPTGGTKTVTWATTPVYENPLGEEIATVSDVNNKVDKVSGKGLSTNDYTTAEKNKLAGLATDTVRYGSQTLTDAQKTQARTNIGAGTSNFSGNYADLSGTPTIPTVLPNPKALKFGSKSYDGNTEQTLTAADLGLSGVLRFIGTTTTALTDGSTTNSIAIGGKNVTAVSADVTRYGGKEFVWLENKWEELGDESSHALKTIEINAGSGLTGGGNLTENRTISHADTSTQASITPSDRTYVTGVTLDGFGHVTGLSTGTETVTPYTLPIATETALGGVKSGGDITVNPTTGVVTVNDDSHNHTIANVDGLQTALDGKAAVSDIPTNNNQLENGAKYITASDSITGNAATATKATQDGNGNVITSTYLPKTTYEYNKELSFGSTGKLLIGRFPCYDTNITVEINATTSITYHGILIIATQNINTTGGGRIAATVYGDATNTIAPNIYLEYASGSRNVSVYFSPASWSKNLIHIQAVNLQGAATDVVTKIDAIPATATIKPTNALTTEFAAKTDIPTDTGDLTNNAGYITSSGSITGNAATATTATKLGTTTIGGVSQPIYLENGTPKAGNTLGTAATKGVVTTVDTSENLPTSKAVCDALADKVTFVQNNGVNVAGTSKTTYKYNQSAIFAPNGLIMGGTALSAGLTTRGICGVSTPNGDTGACSKENLYLNYDGNNTNHPNGRGVVINAGGSGTDLGHGIYSYCAVRGDAMKAWVEAKGYATTGQIPETPTKLPNPKALKFGSQSYDGSAEKTITAADLGLSSALRFVGITTSELADGSTTNPIAVGESNVDVVSGDVAIYGNKEFLWNGTAWEELGDEFSHALNTIRIDGKDGLTGGGDLKSNIEIKHAMPTKTNPKSTERTYVNKIDLDKFGHVTGLSTGTETVTQYTLPVATDTVLGGIKSGGDITVDSTTGKVTVTGLDSKYAKPTDGIPKTDLATDVQTSLGKADTALQSYTETDPTVPAWAKAATKPTYSASEISGLAAVATSGDYNDLSNTPTIPTNTNQLTNGAGYITSAGSITGNAGSATKLATARTIAVGGALTSTPTAFNGTANISIPVTGVKEAYLSWGGKNFAGSYGPIDAAMIPNLGSNRLAFLKAAGVSIEYSRDGGTNWTDYGATDAQKVGLFSDIGQALYIGKDSSKGIDKSQYMLRITLTTNLANVYTVLNKFVIYVSTNGSSGCYCTIQGRTKANKDAGANTWQTFADKVAVSGWSGYNVINTAGITTYGNTSSQYQEVRFTFGVTSHSSASNYAGLTIMRIFGFGGVGWTTPSTMAAKGSLYNWDYQQNATFPAKVTATKFKGDGSELTNVTPKVATASAIGGVKLFSDTKQTVAANTVTNTANRTYGVQNNADGQLVVNVPWTDTDTNTDTKVTQTKLDNDTADGDYSILLTSKGQTSTQTTTANFATELKYNPTTATLTANKVILGSDPTAELQAATKRYVDRTVAGAVDYLGTVDSADALAKLTPGKGDFVRVSKAFDGYHPSDMLICETPKIDSTAATWSVIHGEIDSNTWVANSAEAAGYVAEGRGHANQVWKTDGNGVPAWRDDTDTHYESNLIVGKSATATQNATTTNSDTYLNLVENAEIRNSHKVAGSGCVTVESDANGNITITGAADENTIEGIKVGTASMTPDGNKIITLGEAAGKGVISTVIATSESLPTSKAVADFVEGKGYITSAGSITGNAATATTATTASKLGTTTVGGASQPIYLNNGVPTKCDFTVADRSGNAASDLNWTETDKTTKTVPTYNTLAYWNGSYNDGHNSNLTYCVKGAFGGAAVKNVVTSVDTSANLPTSNAVKTFVEGKGYITASGSITGNAATATTATKLGTNAGSSINPVYFSDGVPVMCDFSVSSINSRYVKMHSTTNNLNFAIHHGQQTIAQDGTAMVYFPVAFANTNYSIVVLQGKTNQADNYMNAFRIDDKTRTTCTIKIMSLANTFEWIAIGQST